MINSYIPRLSLGNDQDNDQDKEEGYEEGQSEEAKDRSFRCQIACKLIGLNTVEIFDIHD